MIDKNTWFTALILGLVATGLPLSQSVWAAKQKTAEEAQIDILIRNAKTKADHEKIAHMLDQEAIEEEAKARDLEAQSEAYKEHQHSQYGKNIEELREHTDALAHHYEDAAKRHKALAGIHRQIAGGMEQ